MNRPEIQNLLRTISRRPGWWKSELPNETKVIPAKIKKAYESGKTLQQISDRVGLSIKVIRKVLTWQKVKIHPRGQRIDGCWRSK